MSACHSECDCGNPSVKYHGPHDPDCHFYDVCDEGRYCDRHLAEAEAEHAYLRHVPRYMVIDDEQSRQELAEGLRDARRWVRP